MRMQGRTTPHCEGRASCFFWQWPWTAPAERWRAEIDEGFARGEERTAQTPAGSPLQS